MIMRTRWAERVTRWWWRAVLLLALVLPFELVNPWFSVGTLAVLTDVEIVAYAALALWLIRQGLLGQAPRWRTAFTMPITILLTAALLSALFAPSENWHAFKVSARWCTGVATFYMIVNALDAGLPLRRLMQALAVSGIVVAAFALLEATNSRMILAVLAPFRQEPSFEVGGELRVSSTLPYPTVAAMVLEFAFCWVLGWIAESWSERRVLQACILFGALLLVTEAIVLTLTRGALISSAAALVLVVCVRWRAWRFDAYARAVLAAWAGLAALVLAGVWTNPVYSMRLSSESDRSWYQARYTVAPLPSLRANEMLTVSVQVQNTGQQTWPVQGTQSVHLFYHWLSADRSTVRVADGLRTPLPHDLAPAETITITASVQTPAQAGDYLLAWDMVREGMFWFSTLGVRMYEMPVTIVEGSQPIAVSPTGNGNGTLLSPPHLERGELWNAALRMVETHPLFGVGAGNFRLLYGNYLGLPLWDNRLHANNTYLEMFADTGLLGGVAFVLLVLTFLREAAGALQGRRDANALWVASSAAALCAFCIHGVVDYFLEFTSTALLFWIALGILAALATRAKEGS